MSDERTGNRDHSGDILELTGTYADSQTGGIDDAAGLTGRERRLNLRAYSYWESLLNGRDFPSITDMSPDKIEAFRDNSLLLDFTRDPEKPVLRYIGNSLREEAGVSLSESAPDSVPGRSLVSRLTDHYLEILANRAPIGFEAEFVSRRGTQTLYRGILLPLSDDNVNIDFIYGVISWKERVDDAQELLLETQLADAMSQDNDAPAANDVLTLVDPVEPEILDLAEVAQADEPLELGAGEEAEAVFDLSDDLALDDAETGDSDDALDLVEVLDQAADVSTPASPRADGLADLLAQARARAEAVQSSDHRSRAALYDALSQAHAFACAALADPDEFAEILDDAGLKMQARAPFTPITKLVFGADYDKTRLTEFSAALSYAHREDVPATGFRALIDNQSGGLKGLVKAEREARKSASGNAAADRLESLREAARSAPSLGRVEIGNAAPGEFVLLLGRRDGNGDVIEIVGDVANAEAMIATALRRLPATKTS